MFNVDRWQEIWGTIRRNKLRTFLTALSVAWGIFMLVILLGAGTGLQNSVGYKFRDDAVNSIWLFGGKTSKPYNGHAIGRKIQFTNDDYEAIKNQIPGVERITSRFRLQGDRSVSYGNKHSSFQVRATHPDHKYLEKTLMTSGRFLNDLDLDQRRKVTVIGQLVSEFLFQGADPLGKYININGIQYKVVGVFEDVGGESEMRKVYIPITTAQMAYNGANRVHQIMFTIGGANVVDSKRIASQVRSLLASRHNFAPDDKRAIRLRNNLERFQEIDEIFTMIRWFIWIVGTGTIIAGIVGVSNIMLISVKERTREIGVRKAMGATPWSVVALILQESVLLTAVAGYCGLMAGVAAVEAAASTLPNSDYLRNPEVDLGVVFGATILLVVFGALAGFFPARRAARINPIEALRDE